MMEFNAIIDGESYAAGSLDVFSAFEPELQIGSVEYTNATGLEQALRIASERAATKSQWLAKHQRIKILQALILHMQKDFELLCDIAIKEGGKPLVDTKIEVNRAIEGIENCIDCIKNEHGTEIPMGANEGSAKKLAFTTNEPIGVVVAVSAFNHPLNLIVHQIGPAIAAGCPVIIKPSKDTPLSCFYLVDLLRKAGLPEGWCQAILFEKSSLSEQLVTDARVAFFSFIGSAKVGWYLKSKLAPGTRCALEHGGIAPVIVDDTVNLPDIIPAIVKGSFYHAGQVCVSVQRIYVQQGILPQFIELLKTATEKLIVGDPLTATTDVGPLIRPAEVKRVHTWVTEALAEGAELVTGGKPISAVLYEPTILLAPNVTSTVSTHEVFGPIVNVYGYKNIEEAIASANQGPFSFQGSVFTQSIDKAMTVYQHLNAATVMVNDHSAFRVDWMPFAGLKHSGYGVGGIPHTFKDMRVEKMLVLNNNIGRF